MNDNDSSAGWIVLICLIVFMVLLAINPLLAIGFVGVCIFGGAS